MPHRSKSLVLIALSVLGLVLAPAPRAPAQQAFSGLLKAISRAAGEPATDRLLPKERRLTIPVSAPSDNVQVENRNGHVWITAHDGSLKQLLTALARANNLNLVFAESEDPRITIALQDVPLDDALDTLLAVAGLTWTRHNDIVVVTSRDAGTSLSPQIQGKIVRVIDLDFVAAEDVTAAIQGFLSPGGRVAISSSSSLDNRKTKDTVLVEDYPAHVEQVERYIAQIDQAPRQVMIEAYVLEVELSTDNRHGVDLNYLSQLVDPDLKIRGSGFANSSAPQAFFVELNTEHIGGLLEAIRSTTDAKTLASPKIMGVNGQESRIQIGQQLGFRVLTVTETSTVESIQFLDTGVVLRVTPRIASDGRVLMRVKPEVSSGQVNPDTGLPEEETTEVETDILLGDGQGMVIGGLIKEEDTNVQSKVPLIGDIPRVGALFQRRQLTRSRSEVIIALIPHVVPWNEPYEQQNQFEFHRASTPLLTGPLHPVDRPWEPRLADATTEPLLVPGLITPCMASDCARPGCDATASLDVDQPMAHQLLCGLKIQGSEPSPYRVSGPAGGQRNGGPQPTLAIRPINPTIE